jgi:hypothetical protein
MGDLFRDFKLEVTDLIYISIAPSMLSKEESLRKEA